MRRLAGLVAAGALALAGCGGSEAEPGGGSAPEDAEKAAFPVTFEHKHGSTTIEAEPKRVVVVGLREQDALLALGVVPVATTEWIPGSRGGVYPWAEDELGDAQPPKLLKATDGVPIEEIASLQPDLILGVYSGLTKKEYTTLSKFAPVVAQPKGKPDFGTSWQEETLLSGRAVGRPDAARALVAKTEKLIADTAAEHPEFAGKEAAMAMDYQGTLVYGPSDVRSRTLAELGFEYPKSLRDSFANEYGGQLSDERLDELDIDALVWFAEPKGAAKLKRGGDRRRPVDNDRREARRLAAGR